MVVVVAGAFLAVRSVGHQRARSLALPVVAELGGKAGSITAPFGGTEYYISFAGCTLTRDDVERLVVLNALASGGNYVSLSLQDATIADADRAHLLQTLSEIRVLPGSERPGDEGP